MTSHGLSSAGLISKKSTWAVTAVASNSTV
jgi:hypothetical protein